MQTTRPELSEASFRRYEATMAEAATKGRALVNPAPLKPTTWVAKWREARLAFLRFSYKSASIPKGFDIRRLSAKALSDGTVLVECEAFQAAKLPQVAPTELTCTLATVERALATRQPSQPILLVVKTDEERIKAQALCLKHADVFIMRFESKWL